MKIIRWLLSHTFLILLIVTVIYGYMFWGNLAGEDTPAGKAITYLSNEFEGVGEFVAAVKAKQKKLRQQESPEVHEPPSPENDTSTVAASVDSDTQTQLAETQTTEKTVEKNNFTAPVDESRRSDYAVADDRNENRNDYRSVEQQQVNISYSHNDTRVTQNAAGVIETVIEPVTSNIESKNTAKNAQPVTAGVTKDTFVSMEVEKQLNNVDMHGRLKRDAQQDGTVKASWIAARKSFYQRNYALSEQKYQDVIDKTEDNYDAYGELGNVYFNQGKKQQAATAYFEAAAILLRKGQAKRARSLIGLLRHLDKSKAKELQELIDSSLS